MDLSGATLISDFSLPNFWPLPRPVVLYEAQLSDGHLTILAAPSGGLTYQLFRDGPKGSELSDSIETAPFVLAGGNFIRCAATFVDGAITAVACNREFVFSRDQSFSSVDRLLVERREPKGQVDFVRRNEEAQERRAKKVSEWQAKPDRIAGGRDYLIAALDDEFRQLMDLVKLIKMGGQHHLPGLASRIRLLVANKPLGLIQHVAALLNQPLLMYTNADPFEENTNGPLYGFSLHGSAMPTDQETNPIDLDVWLTAPALVTQSKSLTAGELIKDIGDTIGSHRDVDMTQTIAAMTRRPALSGSRYNDVAHFLVMAADVLVGLSTQLLAVAREPQPQ